MAINEILEQANKIDDTKERMVFLERELAATEYLAGIRDDPVSAHKIGNWLYDSDTAGPRQRKVWKEYTSGLDRMSFRIHDPDPAQKNFWKEVEIYASIAVGTSLLITAIVKQFYTGKSLFED